VLRKGLLRKIYNFFSVTTVIFAVFAFFNLENWLLRVLMQGSMSLMMLFMGVDTILLKKQKTQGYLMVGVSAFLFFVMINTIIIGFKIGAF